MTEASGDHALDEVRARLDALARETEALENDVRAAAERLRAGLGRVRDQVEALQAVEAAAGPGDRASAQDADGARLIALDLVLSGTPRAQALSQLSAQFPDIDAERLFDEVKRTTSG